MSKTRKIWLITATILFTLGAIIFIGTLSYLDWDFKKLGTRNYITNTHDIADSFDNISIDVTIAEVYFVLSSDDKCKVECYEDEKIMHSAAVENNTLVIRTVDKRKWYDYIGIFIDNMKITIYLPEKEYMSLLIETNTGDVSIPSDFTFNNIDISGDTADINCNAPATNSISIETATRDIDINLVNTLDFNISTDTGDIKLEDISCDKLIIETDTGDIDLRSVIAKDRFDIETNTGDVLFEASDAGTITIETDTGDINGSLLSSKIFLIETDTGDVFVPNTTTGGRCQITTDTGDITINLVSNGI